MLLPMGNTFGICPVPIRFSVGMFWVFKVLYFPMLLNQSISIPLPLVLIQNLLFFLQIEMKLYLGYPFHYGHICRALCCRLRDYFNTNPLPEPYRLNHPLIGHTNLKWKEEKNRTNNSSDSLNWNSFDQTIELIEPSIGKRK